jgi:hypothetical protein
VQDIAPFFDIVIVIAAVVTPAIVLVRLVRGGEEGSLANLFAAPDYNAWPRGVQEEEPRPWAFATPATSGASAPSGVHAVRRPSRATADAALSPVA